MAKRKCPKCAQFRGKVHRCPAGREGAEKPPAALVGVGTPSPQGDEFGAPGGGYSAVYDAYRARRPDAPLIPLSDIPSSSPPPASPPPPSDSVPVAPPRDHTRFGKQYEYHGHIAVAVEEAKRVLSTPVDTGDAFDPYRATSLIKKVAQRVHQWRPSRKEVPVYAPQTRIAAGELANVASVTHGNVTVPDYLVFEDGKARYLRPTVARFLTAVRDDLKGSEALRHAARIEYQRAAAKAALATPDRPS